MGVQYSSGVFVCCESVVFSQMGQKEKVASPNTVLFIVSTKTSCKIFMKHCVGKVMHDRTTKGTTILYTRFTLKIL